MAAPATPAHKPGPGVFATPAVPSPFPQYHPNRQQPQRAAGAAAEVLLKPWTARPTRNLSFINAKLIDPKDGATHEHVRLDVREGRIERMLKLTAPVTQPPSEAELAALKRDNIVLVDLAGKFVIPGLIDCHVHLATPPGEDGLKDTLHQDPTTSLLRQPYLAHEMLKRGFTTIRDCGGAGEAMKEALAENLHPGPRLFTCGHAISQTGGHGDLRSAKDAEYDMCGSSGHAHGYGRVADGVDQCLRAAREELRQGADFIKIMVSGGVASPTDRLTSLQYTPEEIRAFVQVAASAETYVTAHAYTAAAIRRAVENGVRGIEHGNFLDEATAALMAEKGAFLTPTLITYASMSAPEFSTFLPPAIAAKNAHVLKVGFNSLQIADKAGVTMCFGTDLLGAMQSKQTGEFALRKRAGLSALKILQSATTNAARMLQKEDRLGRLREGSAADLLILNANPLDDIEVLDRPRKHLLAVIKDGRVLESRWYSLAKDVERESVIE